MTVRRLALLTLLVSALLPVERARPRRSGRRTTGRRRTAWSSTSDVPVTMSDGVILSADVYRPDKPGRYPVLLTQTPYNKNRPRSPSGNEYLVRRGYAHVVVDVRGTGGSQGAWDSFGPNEQRDGAEMVRWARKQPWSNGKVGGYGPSYMAITQLTTAARRPKGLKAIFPIVPMSDSYRDITFSGGQTNVSFIPLWLGLVTGTSLIPPAYALDGDPADLVRGVTDARGHATNVGNFQLNTVLNATAGGDIAYDGEFWKTRSPIELLDRIKVPGVRRRRPPRPLPARRAAGLRAPQAARARAAAHGPVDASERLGRRRPRRQRPALARPDRAALVRPLAEGDEHEDPRDPEGHPVDLRPREVRDAGRLARPAPAPDAAVPARGQRAHAPSSRSRTRRRTASSSTRCPACARRARASGPRASPSRSRARTTTA